MSTEEQKQSDVHPQSNENTYNTPEKLNLSHINIQSFPDQRTIVLQPVGKQSKEKSCQLFKISKGKQLIYNSIVELYENASQNDKKNNTFEITLIAKQSASYMLIQTLADLQINNYIKIVSTTPNITKDDQEIHVKIQYLHKSQ